MSVETPVAGHPDAGKSSLPARSIPRLRMDLEVSRQRYEQQAYAVIKDPISLQYFRMPWRDYRLMRLMEGCRNHAEVIKRWKKRVPELQLEMDDSLLLKKVAGLIRDFETKKLCELSAARLLSHLENKKNQKSLGRRISWLVGWLVIRKSLFDPDPLLTWLTPKVSFLFRPWFSISALLLLIAAGATLALHWHEIAFDLGWFLAFDNLILLIVSIILLKIVHEIGHGVTCKHFGGEVHEVGFMLMILTPMFYVNTSDTWLFPNKKHRMAVSAAGVYVELIFASLLVFVWLSLAPGFWKQFTFNAILAASITTLLFNANPLMRFDGYYILSDWLEIPNLRQKSSAYLSQQFRRVFFGKTFPNPAAASTNRRASYTFTIYAVLSSAYLLVVMSHVFGRLHLLDKYGLSILAYVLVAMWATAALALPITRFFRNPYKSASHLTPMQRLRPVFVLALIALVLVAIASIPFPKTVVRACALELANAYVVRASEPGFVSEILTSEGDVVEKGQVLAKLRSPDLKTRLATQRESLQQAETQLNQAISENSALKFKFASHLRDEILADLRNTESKVAQLDLTSGLQGRVLSRNLIDKKGRYLEAGESFCLVGPASDFSILIPLSENEARYIKRGAPVVLKVAALPEMTFRGEIVQEPLAAIAGGLPASLTARRGGDVATTIDTSGEEKLLERQWYAQLKISESSHLLRPGMTGRVRVNCGMETIGRILGQKVLDFIKLDYRL